MQTESSYQRSKRQSICRASIALWLSKHITPLTAEEIHSAMTVQFPWLSLGGLRSMLGHNADMSFEQHGNGYVFSPNSCFLFCGTKTQYGKIMSAARAAWFAVRGLEDEVGDTIAESTKESKERQERMATIVAVEKTRHIFSALATASAVADYQK